MPYNDLSNLSNRIELKTRTIAVRTDASGNGALNLALSNALVLTAFCGVNNTKCIPFIASDNTWYVRIENINSTSVGATSVNVEYAYISRR